MYSDDIKHPTWLCRVDYSVDFVVLKFMNEMFQHCTRFYVMLAPFCFLYSALNFSNQRDLLFAYSLAAQAKLQSVYLHQARYGSDHFLYKHWFCHNMCVFRAYAMWITGLVLTYFCVSMYLCVIHMYQSLFFWSNF